MKEVKFEGGPVDGQIIEVDENSSEYRIVEPEVEYVYVRKINDCSNSFWYAGSTQLITPPVQAAGTRAG